MALTSHTADAPIATIDMGSNSFYLLISQWREQQLQTLHREVERVQTAILMDGARLTGIAEKRVLDCLAHFRQVAEQYGCERIIAVGTSALRQAVNPDALLQAAQELLGWPVIVLRGEEEARYIYQAVAAYRGGDSRQLVLDIGGGSTEMVLGAGDQIIALESIPQGCVRSLKQHFHDGALNSDRFARSLSSARDQIQAVAHRFPLAPDTRVIGCSGTAQAIAAVLGVERVNMQQLCGLRDHILDRFDHIAAVHFACLDANRSKLLIPGLSLLIALYDTLGIQEMALADVALREGVAIAWWSGDSRLHIEPPKDIAI